MKEVGRLAFISISGNGISNHYFSYFYDFIVIIIFITMLLLVNNYCGILCFY